MYINTAEEISGIPASWPGYDLDSGSVTMLAAPPFGASSNISLWRATSKPPVELVVADLENKTKSPFI